VSGALAAPPMASAPAGEPDYRPKTKTDQWIVWWSLPIFYNLFGLIFVLLARVMPPPQPTKSPAAIEAFFHVHSATIKIGFGLLMVIIGLSAWANGLVAVHMKRMSVGSVWVYVYIGSLGVGAIPGCLLPAFCFLAAVFRPDRDPHTLAMLYDMTFLFFVGSLGCFAAQYFVLALAILLDRNQIFPKWFAYVSIWQIVTEVLAAPVFIFKDGPFAWDGSIAFYQGTAIFVIYEVCFIYLLRKAIQQQPLGEPIQDL
jgi:hypothetical protein